MTQQRPIRILICEDQTLMREGLKTILELDEGQPPFEIIGEAADHVLRYDQVQREGVR